jgi:hypothetical protein
MPHEVISADFIDVELIELKFNLDRGMCVSKCYFFQYWHVSQYIMTTVTSASFPTINLSGRQPSSHRQSCSMSHKAFVKPSLVQTDLLTRLQLGWLWVYLKIYIRALQQSSDLDEVVEEKLLVGDRPKLQDHPDNHKPLNERLVERPAEERKEVYWTFLCVLNA